MNRFSAFLVSAALFTTGGLLLSLNGCGGASRLTGPSTHRIEHVVVIVQENRTPDNMFQDPVLINNRKADIAQSGLNSLGQTVALTQNDITTNYDLGHYHPDFVAMYDGGKMDGADKVTIYCNTGATNCPPPNAAFQYVNPAEVQPYFQMAEQYTFADGCFRPTRAPVFRRTSS